MGLAGMEELSGSMLTSMHTTTIFSRVAEAGAVGQQTPGVI